MLRRRKEKGREGGKERDGVEGRRRKEERERRKTGDSESNSHSADQSTFQSRKTNGLFSARNEYVLSEEDEKCWLKCT